MTELHAVAVAAVPAVAVGVLQLARKFVTFKEVNDLVIQATFVAFNVGLTWVASVFVPVSFIESAMIAIAVTWAFKVGKKGIGS
jgi:hypothetical protein